MPPHRNDPQNKSTSHWKPADYIKQLNLVNQGRIDPEGHSIAVIKKFHAKEWLHKAYKLEKLHTARVIEGARKAQSRIEQEGKMNCIIDCF